MTKKKVNEGGEEIVNKGIFSKIGDVERKFINNGEFKKGFCSLFSGVKILCVETYRTLWGISKFTGLSFHHSFVKHPYPWSLGFFGLFFAYHMISVGECRLERDNSSHRSYEVSKNVCNLEASVDSYKNENMRLKADIEKLRYVNDSLSKKRVTVASSKLMSKTGIERE